MRSRRLEGEFCDGSDPTATPSIADTDRPFGLQWLPAIAYNRHPMHLDRMLLFVFVLYCSTAGVVFLLLPWSPGYDQMLYLLRATELQPLRATWVRGAISGFGLVHLVWGIHDLAELLRPPVADGGRS